MAELLDPRPKLVLVMGCNGAGKSAWKRANYERLPQRYFDQDSIAGGIGDWNDEDARSRTREYVDGWIDECFTKRLDFGFESAFSGSGSGRPGPALLTRALGEGYQVEGYYIGTESPQINASRIAYRVLSNTGHYVDARRLPSRYRYSLSNLRRHLRDFELVEVVDNSQETVDRIPDPVTEFVAERGQVTMRLPETDMAAWCAELLQRFDVSQQQEKLREERRVRKQERDR